MMFVHIPTATDNHLEDQASFLNVFLTNVWSLWTNLGLFEEATNKRVAIKVFATHTSSKLAS
jgi:hypothetical protein